MPFYVIFLGIPACAGMTVVDGTEMTVVGGNARGDRAVCQQPLGPPPYIGVLLLHNQLPGRATIRHLQRVAVVEERK